MHTHSIPLEISTLFNDVQSLNTPTPVLKTELGSTKTIVAGHDHVNCSCIKYKGVRFTYSLKTGMSAYWRPEMNGGTVFTVTSDGVTTVKHEFVDPTPWLEPKEEK
ncbi:MAG: hypothetical protein IJF26_02155 [Clostridia bacterium]|nr:hypothetical protein [Clostridia bacterium]